METERAGAEGTATVRQAAVARSGLQLGHPPLEEAPLARRACEGERALERIARSLSSRQLYPNCRPETSAQTSRSR